jgi:uncharacterized protein (DUF1697 family)
VARAGTKEDDVYVAFLRGINVGGKNRLPMKDLVAMLDEAGGRDVQTYIQSGNAVFRATEACAARIPDAIAKRVADRLGFRAPVVMRTAGELRAIARGNPFLRAGADPKALHVMFLADLPTPARIAALDPGRSPPDEFAARGREIYLRCPNGVGRSKLTNQYFDTKLATTSTMRNWRTVLKLVEMTGA